MIQIRSLLAIVQFGNLNPRSRVPGIYLQRLLKILAPRIPFGVHAGWSEDTTQWGLRQRPLAPTLEPGRKSPRGVIWRNTSDRSISKVGSDSDLGFGLAYHTHKDRPLPSTTSPQPSLLFYVAYPPEGELKPRSILRAYRIYVSRAAIKHMAVEMKFCAYS